MKWKIKGHELDEIWASLKIDKNKQLELYIFGAGHIGRILGGILDRYKNVKGYIDNNIAMQGVKISGIKTMSINDYKGSNNRKIIVAVNDKYIEEIFEQLIQLGYERNKDFFHIQDFLDFYYPIIVTYYYDKTFVNLCQICVTERCTLRCEKCAHGCSYVSYKDSMDLDIADVKQSADCFFSKVNHVANFSLLGGEPLLYSELDEAIEYIGDKYRGQINKFYITTNGTIIPGKKVLYKCVEYGVSFLISNYSKHVPQLKEKIEKLIDVLEHEGIEYQVGNEDDKWIDFGFDYVNNSEAIAQHIFDGCKTDCREIRGNQYHYCVMARSSAQNMGKRLADNDYLDMDKLPMNNYRKILLEYSLGYSEKGYLEMCKHCKGMRNNNSYIEQGIQRRR